MMVLMKIATFLCKGDTCFHGDDKHEGLVTVVVTLKTKKKVQ